MASLVVLMSHTAILAFATMCWASVIDPTPCCSACKEGTVKYWANDKPNKQCAETCVSSSDKVRLGELWVLTGGQGKITNETAPCAKEGFRHFDHTSEVGASPFSILLDKYYDPDDYYEGVFRDLSDDSAQARTNTAPCCSTCKEGTTKYWANDKPNKQCAETCVLPSDNLRLGELWVLTGGQGKMTNETAPCAKEGFHHFNHTSKLGAGPLSILLDKYDPDNYDGILVV